MEKQPLSKAQISWWPGRRLGAIELEAVYLALTYYDGNKTHAAESLGLTVATIRRYVRMYSMLSRFRIPMRRK